MSFRTRLSNLNIHDEMEMEKLLNEIEDKSHEHIELLNEKEKQITDLIEQNNKLQETVNFLTNENEMLKNELTSYATATQYLQNETNILKNQILTNEQRYKSEMNTKMNEMYTIMQISKKIDDQNREIALLEKENNNQLHKLSIEEDED